jgi:hypothetical protein
MDYFLKPPTHPLPPQTVDEDDTLLNFALALKKHSLNTKTSLAGVKKPRHSGKSKGR